MRSDLDDLLDEINANFDDKSTSKYKSTTTTQKRNHISEINQSYFNLIAETYNSSNGTQSISKKTVLTANSWRKLINDS